MAAIVRKGKTTHSAPLPSVSRSAASGQHRVRPSFGQDLQQSRPAAFPGGTPTWKDQQPSDSAAIASYDDVPNRKMRAVPKEANPCSSDFAPKHPDLAARSRAWCPPASDAGD